MAYRNENLDTLKGLACLLVVLFHSIGAEYTGLKLQTGFYRELADLLIFIRMPLFAFLSGVIYSYRPAQGNIKHYVSGKFRRLIVPMFTIGTIFALVQLITPGVSLPYKHWYLMHIIPVSLYWFLEAMFFIFMLMILLERLRIFDKVERFIPAFIASILISSAGIEIKYFSLSGILYLLPYFLLGSALSRFKVMDKLSPRYSLVFMLPALILVVLIGMGAIDYPKKYSPLAIFIGTLSCVSLLSLKFSFSIFSRIGAYSFSIYLFHAFFTAAVRIIYYKLDIFNPHLILLTAVILGLLCPIIAELVFKRHNLTRLLFLGLAPTKKIS